MRQSATTARKESIRSFFLGGGEPNREFSHINKPIQDQKKESTEHGTMSREDYVRVCSSCKKVVIIVLKLYICL